MKISPCKVCNEFKEDRGFMFLNGNMEVTCFDCQLSIMCQFLNSRDKDVNEFVRFFYKKDKNGAGKNG